MHYSPCHAEHFTIIFNQPCIIEILVKKSNKIYRFRVITLIESWDDLGQNVLNVVLVMLNIFAITFYQLSITVLVILVKNITK